MDILSVIEQAFDTRGRYTEKIIPMDEMMRAAESSSVMGWGIERKLSSLVGLLVWKTMPNGTVAVLEGSLAVHHDQYAILSFSTDIPTEYHKHNYVELAIVAEGRLCQRISGKDEHFSQREICLIGEDSLHTDYLKAEHSTIIFLAIDHHFFDTSVQKGTSGTSVDSYIRELILKRKKKYNFVHFRPQIEKTTSELLVAHIIDEILNPRAGSDNLVKGYVERLFSVLPSEYLISLSQKEQGQMRRMLFEDMSTYMAENLQSMTAKKLAEVFHYTPDHLSRVFTEHSGMSFSKYLQDLRLDKAVYLLRYTDSTVEEIAKQVGYSNLGFFYKIFFNKFDTTPNSYRIQ